MLKVSSVTRNVEFMFLPYNGEVRGRYIKDFPERFVEDYFTNLGWLIEDCRRNNKNGSDVGHPDYKMTHLSDEEIYVEVKWESSGLTMAQFFWMEQNPDKRILVVFVYLPRGRTCCRTKAAIEKKRKLFDRKIHERLRKRRSKDTGQRLRAEVTEAPSEPVPEPVTEIEFDLDPEPEPIPETEPEPTEATVKAPKVEDLSFTPTSQGNGDLYRRYDKETDQEEDDSVDW